MNTSFLKNILQNKKSQLLKTPYTDSTMNFDINNRFFNSKASMGRFVNNTYVATVKPFDFCEFSEFPAISSFMEIYGNYPNIARIHITCDYNPFIDRVKKINKGFYFDTVFSYGKTNYISFMCLNDLKMKSLYYITISSKSTTDDSCTVSISALFNPKEDSILFLNKIKKEVFFDLTNKEVKNKGFLNILVSKNNSYDLQKIEIKCPEIDFELNYNSDFKPIHDIILERLSEDKSKGLVLLHGKAGTGKTNYIRYLINHLKKKVIYIPPNMSNSISDPNLIKFFIEHSNSILVIEDAENVLMKRASNSTQAISNILNLTDGLLSDCTNIQVIATFNTDVLNIDEALLRKGRLISKYEFSELEPEITEKLAIKIGSDVRGKKVLAEIYNEKDESFTDKKEKIGFNK